MSEFILGKKEIKEKCLGFEKVKKVSSKADLITYNGDAHILTVGKTGSGKSRNVVIPNALTWKGSAVILDVKGEIYHTTARARRAMGQKIVVYDPFNLVTKESARMNPFEVFDLDENIDSDIESQNLANIFSVKSLAKEPFWDLQGTSLLSGGISVVGNTFPPEQRNFRELMKLFMHEDVVYNLAVQLDTIGKKMSGMAYHEISSFVGLTEVTRSGVYATMSSYLKILNSKTVIDTLCDSTFNIQDINDVSKPMTVYIVMPPAYIKSHFAIIKIWVYILMKIILNRKEIPEIPTLFLLDELAQFGEFPILENMITMGRGYGVKVHCVLQNLQQLQRFYPDSWRTIVGNCDVLQMFAPSDFQTAKELENLTGISASEFMALKSDEQYLCIKGENIKANRVDYLTDKMFKGLFDDNPYYKGKSK